MASPAAAEALAGLRRDPSYWKLKQEVKEAVLGLSTIRKEVPTAKGQWREAQVHKSRQLTPNRSLSRRESCS